MSSNLKNAAPRLRLLFFSGCLMALFFSCEKNEVIVVDDGQTFCPVNFRYSGIDFIGSCPYPGPGAQVPFLYTENEGVVLRQSLFERSTRYLSWIDDLEHYRAYNVVDTGTTIELQFDKIEMDTGTRMSLFLGPTLSFVPGEIWESADASESTMQPWQVWVRRESGGLYTLGYTAAQSEYVVQSDLTEFEAAHFALYTFQGQIRLEATLFANAGGTAPIAGFEEDYVFPAGDPLFAGIGMELIPEEKQVCGAHPLEIRLREYHFKNTAGIMRFDNFTCNTIWPTQ